MPDYIDKINVNGTEYNIKGDVDGNTVYYGTCATAAATVLKEATIADFPSALTTGLKISVRFTNTNTAANPTLSINSGTAVAIKRYGTTAVSTSATTSWNAGSVVSMTYDGTYWIIDNWLNSTYSTISQADIENLSGTNAGLITGQRFTQGFNKRMTSSAVTDALGYTPYDSTNPNGYTSNTGTITGVSVNNTSIATSGVANLVTNTAYNATTNKLATMSDVPSVTSTYSSTGTNAVNGTAVNAALQTLDSSITATTNQAISAITITDGKISDSSKVTIPTVTNSYSSTGTDAVSGQAVSAALQTLDSSITATTGQAISAITVTDGKIASSSKINVGDANQNAFSNVKVGSTTIAADTTTDTLELVAGTGITLTPDATNDKVTIASTASGDNSYRVTLSYDSANDSFSTDKTYDEIVVAINSGKQAYIYDNTGYHKYTVGSYELGVTDIFAWCVSTGAVGAGALYNLNFTCYNLLLKAEIVYMIDSSDNVSTVANSMDASSAVTDVRINNNSIVTTFSNSRIANFSTNTAYNSSTNKIATMADVPSYTATSPVDITNNVISLEDGYGDIKNPYGTKNEHYVLAGGSSVIATYNDITTSSSDADIDNNLSIEAGTYILSAHVVAGSSSGSKNITLVCFLNGNYATSTALTGTEAIDADVSVEFTSATATTVEMWVSLSGTRVSTTFSNIKVSNANPAYPEFRALTNDDLPAIGNIQNTGALQTTDVTITTGDKLVITDNSDSNKMARASLSFDTTNTTQYLRKDGTWATPSGGGSDAFKITLSYNNGTYTIDKTYAEVEAAVLANKYVYIYDNTRTIEAGYQGSTIVAPFACMAPTEDWFFFDAIAPDYNSEEQIIRYVLADDGVWADQRSLARELPYVNTGDNGKVLKVVNGAWRAATSSGGGLFLVNFSTGATLGTYTADKTFAQIVSAVNGGSVVMGQYIGEYFSLTYFYEGDEQSDGDVRFERYSNNLMSMEWFGMDSQGQVSYGNERPWETYTDNAIGNAMAASY